MSTWKWWIEQSQDRDIENLGLQTLYQLCIARSVNGSIKKPIQQKYIELAERIVAIMAIKERSDASWPPRE